MSLRTKWLFLSLILAFVLSACAPVALPVPSTVTPVPIETAPKAAATAAPLPTVEIPVDAVMSHRVAFIQEGTVWLVQMGAEAVPTLPDFQGILAEQGLDIATLDTTSESYRLTAGEVLGTFAATHLEVIEADRQTTFGETVDFEPLVIERIEFGGLPGVHYGFTLSSGNGEVMERVISFAAFDEAYLYVFNAVYDPAYEPSFPSDEALLAFEPFLRQIVARLPLSD